MKPKAELTRSHAPASTSCPASWSASFAPSGSATTPQFLQPRSDAISWSGGRNLHGRSWGGVTNCRTPILCVTSTRG